MTRLIICALLAAGVLVCRPPEASAATVKGTVKEITKDHFTVTTDKGQTLVLKPSKDLQDGVAGLEDPAYRSRLKDMKVGQVIKLDYKQDRKTGDFICTCFLIEGEYHPRRFGAVGTVKEVKKDQFTLLPNKEVTGKEEALVLKPCEELQKGLTGRNRRGQKAGPTDLKVGQYISVRYFTDPKTGDVICTHFAIFREPKP